MLRTILLSLLAFRRCLNRLSSSPSDLQVNRQVSGIVNSTLRKYTKVSTDELLNILRRSQGLDKGLYWIIPRSIVLDYSQNVMSLVYFLLIDYSTFMANYIGQYAQENLLKMYVSDYVNALTLSTTNVKNVVTITV